MVIWYRILQVILTMFIMWGVGAMFTYVYDTTNYTHGMMVLFAGTIIIAFLIVWVGTIQNNIMKIKGE